VHFILDVEFCRDTNLSKSTLSSIGMLLADKQVRAVKDSPPPAFELLLLFSGILADARFFSREKNDWQRL
jgi:hypothetical protein